jgi:hypothetical protein
MACREDRRRPLKETLVNKPLSTQLEPVVPDQLDHLPEHRNVQPLRVVDPKREAALMAYHEGSAVPVDAGELQGADEALAEGMEGQPDRRLKELLAVGRVPPA